jgi:hypothetical protein
LIFLIVVNNVDLVGVQELRWDKRGTVRAGDYIFPVGWAGHVECMEEKMYTGLWWGNLKEISHL